MRMVHGMSGWMRPLGVSHLFSKSRVRMATFTDTDWFSEMIPAWTRFLLPALRHSANGARVRLLGSH